MTEPVNLSSISVKDFQGIHAIDVTFQAGKTTYVSGANGAGKSSLMHSIAVVLFGADYAGAMPIRKGQKRANIVATLSNGWRCEMIFTENGAKLTITDASGLTKGTPRAILNKLIGQLAFDPLRFITELDAKAQIAQLKTICGLDFTELDKRRAELYGRRTDVNREAKSADAAFQAATWHTDAPAEEIKVEDLMDTMKAAREHNAAIFAKMNEIKTGEAALVRVQQKIVEIQAALASEVERERVFTLAIAKLKEFPLPLEKDAAAIEIEIAQSGAKNRKLTENKARDVLMDRANRWQKESANITAEIDAIDADKTARLAATKMPIDGLGFTDDFVTWNGVPLSQVSTREQMEVSFAICASLNPTLRAVIVPHGSLITPSNRPHFEAIAERYGMQPLVELADESGEVPGIVISEGRVVRADNQTAMPNDPRVTVAITGPANEAAAKYAYQKQTAACISDQKKHTEKPTHVAPVPQDGPFSNA